MKMDLPAHNGIHPVVHVIQIVPCRSQPLDISKPVPQPPITVLNDYREQCFSSTRYWVIAT